MTPMLRTTWRRLRLRRAVAATLPLLPWIAIATLLARHVAPDTALPVLAATGLACAAWAWHRQRACNRDWFVRHLDARVPALQDSSGLLFAHPASLNPLQVLQQQRLREHLARHPLPDLRDRLPWRATWIGAGIAVLAAAVLHWPTAVAPPAPAARPMAATTVPQAVLATVHVTPPAYTGLPARTLDGFAAEVEQGSTLQWHVRYTVAPDAARLRFLDGATVELTRDGDDWTASRRVDASALYRLDTDGTAPPQPDAPYRLQVRPDAAPRLRVLEPERTLTLLDAATRRWRVVVEAEDDHGLGAATLELTLAQGSGEQIAVSERRIALRGEGDRRRRRYTHVIDLAQLGYAQGDDLIARIVQRDERTPEPNITRSAAFILRWPASPGGEGTGVEGLVQTAMPAYFRSQRQIVIDTEALVAQRATLDADSVVDRSDAIAGDQRILRLRYGQFLGEESETDAPPPAPDAHDDDAHAEDAPAEAHDDGHDHAPPPANASADDLMRAAGHLHDLPEAATLLDPATRDLLRAALDEMWQAEGALRIGQPERALPFERRALDYIKRVQQADRIYLARVGLELPALDAARRLTGERPRGARRDPLVPRGADDDVPAQAWRAMQDGTPLPLDALLAWLRDPAHGIDDPLALLEQVDALRRDDRCAPCRESLRRALWPLLDVPPAAPRLRPAPDAVGRAYLDALAPRDGDAPR